MFTDEELKEFECCLAEDYGNELLIMARFTGNSTFQRIVLATDSIENLQLALARNKYLDRELQVMFARESDIEVRDALAMNEGLCQEAQEILSEDPERSVRFSLAANRNLDSSLRYKMGTRFDEDINCMRIPVMSGCNLSGERIRVFFFPAERKDIRESLIKKYGTFIMGNPQDIIKTGKRMAEDLMHFESTFVYFDGHQCIRPQMGRVLLGGVAPNSYHKIERTLADLKNSMYMTYNFVKVQNGHSSKDFTLRVGEDSVFLLSGKESVFGVSINENGYFSVSDGRDFLYFPMEAYRTGEVSHFSELETLLNSLDLSMMKEGVKMTALRMANIMGYGLGLDLNWVQTLGYKPFENRKGVGPLIESFSEYMDALKVHLRSTPDVPGEDKGLKELSLSEDAQLELD